jgi:methionyl-tRNA formyltransferase
VRIAVAATPEVAIPTLDALLASEHELVCVITRPDAPAGRGRALQATPVANWAVTNSVKLFKPETSQSARRVDCGSRSSRNYRLWITTAYRSTRKA